MKTVARLREQERKELFSETAVKMGVTASAAEKDFWICWVLLHVFKDDALSQCLRFKGGTSLSKCYNAIERFSEDIDLILDWTQLTQEDPTESRSKTKQGKLNQTINEQGDLLAEVVLFKQKFYPSGWANYDSATFAGLLLQPSEHHINALKTDYEQMREMLFGDKPNFDEIIAALKKLEDEVKALQA